MLQSGNHILCVSNISTSKSSLEPFKVPECDTRRRLQLGSVRHENPILKGKGPARRHAGKQRTVAALVNERMVVSARQRAHADASVPVCARMWMNVGPTFLTVVFVLMQHKAVATLTNVRAHCVDALVLAAAVVLAAFIFVCERYNTSFIWEQQEEEEQEQEEQEQETGWREGSERSSRGEEWKGGSLKKGRSVTAEVENSDVERRRDGKGAALVRERDK